MMEDATKKLVVAYVADRIGAPLDAFADQDPFIRGAAEFLRLYDMTAEERAAEFATFAARKAAEAAAKAQAVSAGAEAARQEADFFAQQAQAFK